MGVCPAATFNHLRLIRLGGFAQVLVPVDQRASVDAGKLFFLPIRLALRKISLRKGAAGHSQQKAQNKRGRFCESGFHLFILTLSGRPQDAAAVRPTMPVADTSYL